MGWGQGVSVPCTERRPMAAGQGHGWARPWRRGLPSASGPEAGRLNQADLIATGRELTALIALHHHPAT